MLDVIADAVIDTLKILPFLLAMNIFIELFEHKSGALKADGALMGGVAPLVGTAVGVVPQCGFSVVATELYAKRKIALGTLLAVYIATSDEALPIMLSSYAGVTKVLPVLLVKIVFALVAGYVAYAMQKVLGLCGKGSTADTSTADAANRSAEYDDESAPHAHGCHKHALDEQKATPDVCATKRQKAKYVFDQYFEHPLIHTATVLLYILVVNVAFGIIVYYVGTENISRFMATTGYLQPVIAGLVGLVPNCAASIVITELYVLGGLSLGGAVAGLSVGAGIGYAVLVKRNRPIKNTVAIISVMYSLSVALGMAINALSPLL